MRRKRQGSILYVGRTEHEESGMCSFSYVNTRQPTVVHQTPPLSVIPSTYSSPSSFFSTPPASPLCLQRQESDHDDHNGMA